MNFSLEMNIDNDAFEENPGYEIARILNRLGNRFVSHPDLAMTHPTDFEVGMVYSIHDKNGNRVGSWEIKE